MKKRKGGPPADTSNWGNIYAIDAWGNLYQKNPCNGTICPTKLYSDSLLVTVTNNKNQFDSYAYDANGNLTNDQLGHAFTYDAENRPYSGGGANYYYDGEGERVAKSSGTLYWFGSNSAPILETNLSGGTIAEYVFANGKRWSQRNSAGTILYYFADQVGSAQLVTLANGTLEQLIEYHPYGEERVVSNFITNNYRFTGKEHDSETNDDYFGARYYGSWSGRFLTPDWAATPEPIPYAVMGNPQTLNLYSYVENNPITGTDPDGHADPSSAPGGNSSSDAMQEKKKKAEAELKAWIAQAKAEFEAAKAAVGKREQDAAKGIDSLNSLLGGKSNCAGGSAGDCANAVGEVGTLVYVAVVSDGESTAGKATNEIKVISSIGKDAKLTKLAEEAGQSVQKGLDHLVSEISKGNTNPGIGTKSLGSGISYARARDGARVFFRQKGNEIEILAKASKANEARVINYLKSLYEH